MSDSIHNLSYESLTEFEPPPRSSWNALVEKKSGPEIWSRLSSVSIDGRIIAPLYDQLAEVYPSPEPTERPKIGQVIFETNPEVLTSKIARAIEQAEVVEVVVGEAELFGRAATQGFSAEAQARAEAANVRLELSGGAELADLLSPWFESTGPAVRVHADPWSQLSRGWITPDDFGDRWALALGNAEKLASVRPGSRGLRLGTGTLQEAGASPVQEIGTQLALMAELFRRAPNPSVVEHVFIETRLGTRVFEEVAKLRALRIATRHLLQQILGVDDPVLPPITAKASASMLTKLDPWTNFLRLTAAGVAGFLGGAETMSLWPFSLASGLTEPQVEEWAAHQLWVMAEEAKLGGDCDVFAGAYAVEAWTTDLVDRGWELFCELEDLNGIGTQKGQSHLAAQVRETRTERERKVRTRGQRLIGVSHFPATEQRAIKTRPLPASSLSDSIPFPPYRPSAVFEQLVARVEAARLPAVEVVTVGSEREYRANLDAAENFLHIAKLTTRIVETPEDLHVVAVCGPAEEAAERLATLKSRGARHLLYGGAKPLERFPEVVSIGGRIDVVRELEAIVELLEEGALK